MQAQIIGKTSGSRMKNINKIIKESISKFLLSENKASSLLYRWINYEELLHILRYDRLTTADPEWYGGFESSTNMFKKDKAEYIDGKDQRYISTTRNKNPLEGYPVLKYGEGGGGDLGFMIRITIDGDYLDSHRNFKIKGKRNNLNAKPIDWGYYCYNDNGSNGKESEMNSEDGSTYLKHGVNDYLSYKKHHPMSQAEDRITTTAKYIPNASKFITEIDVLINTNDDQFYDKSNIRKLKTMQRNAEKRDIPITFFTRMKDFMSQNYESPYSSSDVDYLINSYRYYY